MADVNYLTAHYPIQTPLLANLNRLDVNNLRLAGVPLPGITPRLQQVNLGAHCDEKLRTVHPQTGDIRYIVPCPIGPLDLVPIRLCDKPFPTPHGRGGRNVCANCHLDALTHRTPITLGNLRWRLTIQCKRCSQRERNRHPTGNSACDCEARVNAGWKCRECYNDVHLPIRARGSWRSDRLLHCHKVIDRRSKTKRKILVFEGAVRSREACPTPGCGATPWTIPGFNRLPPHPVSHPRATFMCLNCDGVTVYPVGYPGRK